MADKAVLRTVKRMNDSIDLERFVDAQSESFTFQRIFGETLKHEAIDDSDNLSRATEVAYEFSVRR